jgi:cytochrome c-type biogenesis protein CcmH/NrfG
LLAFFGKTDIFFRPHYNCGLSDLWLMFFDPADEEEHVSMFSINRVSMGQLFLCAALFSFSAALVSAQIPGGISESTNARHGGNNNIVGTVFAPDGFPITTRMRIKLNSATYGELLANTDDRGRFVFTGVGAGNFFVVIDSEKEFQPVNYPVDVVTERNPIPETYTVIIRLRMADPAKSPGKASVVNAGNAGVPKKALEFYDSASKLARDKDYKGAIKELKLAVAEYSNYASALTLIGILHLRLNENQEADDALKAALKVDPEGYEPLLNRSIALFRLSKFKDSEKFLRQALKVKPDSSAAQYYLGRTLVKLSKNDEAEKAFLTCVKASPGEYKEAHRFLAAIYLDRKAYDRVAQELEMYLTLVPTASDADHLRQVLAQLKSSSRQK